MTCVLMGTLNPNHSPSMQLGPVETCDDDEPDLWLKHNSVIKSRRLGKSLHILTASFAGEPGLAGFIGAKDNGGGGDNWSYKTCKAQLKSSPPTNPTPSFLQAGCPSCLSPCRSTEGKQADSLGK